MANDQNLKPFVKGHDPRRNKTGSRPSATTILNKLLAGKISKEDAAGKIHILDKDEAIWVNIIADALDEDEDPTVRHRAANMVFDRIYGKPVAPIELSGPEGNPIQFDTNAPLVDRLAALAAIQKLQIKE